MVFWALEQRRKWREQWRKEDRAELVAKMLASDMSTDAKQWVERFARENGIPLDEDRKPTR